MDMTGCQDLGLGFYNFDPMCQVTTHSEILRKPILSQQRRICVNSRHESHYFGEPSPWLSDLELAGIWSFGPQL
ncbi:hypothetical protein A6R68_13339, partial [Neotoma lepida]